MMNLMDRTKPRGQTQIIPVFVTFLVSAAWHGMELSFVKCFFWVGLMDYLFKIWDQTQIVHLMYKNVPFSVYQPFKLLFLHLSMAYISMMFQLMDPDKYYFVYSHMYWFVHWSFPILIAIATVLPKVRKPREAGESGSTTSPTTPKNSDNDKK